MVELQRLKLKMHLDILILTNGGGKKNQEGAYTTKGGSYGIGLDVGAVWSRSKTKLIGR